MTDRARILAVKARLSKAASWTKGAEARTADGKACSLANVNAVCWGLAGACTIEGVAGLVSELVFGKNDLDLRQYMSSDPVHSLMVFNDALKTTHKDVLKFLDTALKLCKS